MKIITWNVNGLRAIWKKGALQELLQKESPDIIGIQETKSLIEQLKDETADEFGYYSFFESATNRKGYSGVAIYSKSQPKKVDAILGKILKLTEEEFLTTHNLPSYNLILDEYMFSFSFPPDFL
jgi:exodeoxyribonuclease III